MSKARFVALLEEAAAQAQAIPFWWRDDDAETATPALDRLLETARHHDLPLALAVIPKDATEALAARMAREPRVVVLQHGWRHTNHAGEGEKKIELGGPRPTAEVLGELRLGTERLKGLFPEKLLPVLVPPWNRIADEVRVELGAIGLAGLSTFGPAPPGEPHWANTHLDIFEWHPARKPLSQQAAYAILSDEIERRLGGDPEPIGILTHHLVHEEASWDLLDELFGLIGKHPGVRWPEIRALFAL